jgi:hypothetical protein
MKLISLELVQITLENVKIIKDRKKKDKGSSVPKDFTLEAFYMVWNENIFVLLR